MIFNGRFLDGFCYLKQIDAHTIFECDHRRSVCVCALTFLAEFFKMPVKHSEFLSIISSMSFLPPKREKIDASALLDDVVGVNACKRSNIPCFSLSAYTGCKKTDTHIRYLVFSRKNANYTHIWHVWPIFLCFVRLCPMVVLFCMDPHVQVGRVGLALAAAAHLCPYSILMATKLQIEKNN